MDQRVPTNVANQANWQSSKNHLRENDFVLVVEQAQNRNQWPLWRVMEEYKGGDGLVRSAQV